MSERTQDSLGGPDDLSERERAAVEAELRALADDEFVIAERYTEWQVRGPTLESDIGLANIAQDELGHARLWYDLLEDLGYDEVDLIWDRDPAEFRHSTLVEQPFESGDWADCVLRSYLYDSYEHRRLGALADSRYAPIADRVGKVLTEEEYHREHAANWLERLAATDEGHDRLQCALDRLFPHALTLFEPTTEEADILDLGIRADPLAELRTEWVAVVTTFLTGLGLTAPADATPPDARGRDGSHTPAWPSLHDELTFTYQQLGREQAPSLMPRPDEADS